MQAIFFFGMMGVFFSLVTSVTVGLFQNATQIKQQRIERTKEIMREVEFALNDGLLQENPSLQGVNLNNLSFALPYTSATSDELSQDPWGTTYEIVSFSENVILLADGTGSMGPSSAIANVTTFGLFSAGPDKTMDTPLPADLATLKFLVPSGDDLLHVFSSYDAMNRTWNRAFEVDNTIEDVAIEMYTRKLKRFLGPTATPVVKDGRSFTPSQILNQYSTCLANFNAGSGSFNGNMVVNQNGSDYTVQCARDFSAANISACAEVSAGQIVVSPQSASCWMSDANMVNIPGYPHMAGNASMAALPNVSSLVPEALGVEHEVSRDPFGGNVVLEFDKSTPHRLVIRRNYADVDWNINYYREVEGVDPNAL